MPRPRPTSFTNKPPECVQRLAQEWLRRRERGQTPDFVDTLGDGARVEVTRVAAAWTRRLVRRGGACCGDCLDKVAQHYPYEKCIRDGLADGLTKTEAAYRCRWIACCRSKRENRFKETGYCKDFDCSDKPKWSGKKAADGRMTRLGNVVSAGESKSRCMEAGCGKAPEMECIWADGRGRAWFCKRHFDAWSKEDTDGGLPKAIVKQRKVPHGVVGERYGEYPATKKAKATGRKCGDGESVGLFIPLPRRLAEKFPSLGDEDGSPSHVTFLYIGDIKDCREQAKLVDSLRECCRKWWPRCRATLGDLSYFDHEDKNRRVPHVTVEFDKDLSGFKHRMKQELHEAGFEVQDRFPEYNPHVTLAYLEGLDGEWDGDVPRGSWDFDEMEIWGLPDLHKVPLGPSVHKVASSWRARCSHRRVAARHIVRKIAGWWAVTRGNPGINPPPVDKGGLMNALPGTDPGEARYNGDGPADIMDGAIDQIDLEYLMAWGRPATKMELDAVWEFCTGPIEEDGSIDGRPQNQWFLEMAAWLGKKPSEITFYQGDTDVLESLKALWKEGDGPAHLEPYRRQMLRAVEENADFRGEDETRDLAESLESRLQVIRDEQFRGRDGLGGPVPEVVIRTEPGRGPR